MSLKTSRLGLLFSLSILVIRDTINAHGNYKISASVGKALVGVTFLNLTDKAMNMEQCFARCLQECPCMSFQIYKNEVCELCATNKDLNPLVFTDATDYVYLSFVIVSKQCQENLQTEINCCATSNPCKNNGLCEPNVLSEHTKRRFRCRCSAGFSGTFCENTIKSCRGYINESRSPGKYKVFNDNMELFDVFCDFDTNSTMAWTLIQSYQLKNNDNFKSLSFLQDNPINEITPVWDSYRLSKSRMESIQQDSSKWRMTCRYDTDGLIYTDYMRNSNDKVNILTYEEARCTEVEFIDVRGYSCSDCRVMLAQGIYVLRVDSYRSYWRCSSQLNESLLCDGLGEDNFGLYACLNPSHRCSSSPMSTTQTWFGNA